MGWNALVNDLSGVQVVHRYLAYLVVVAIIGVSWYAISKQKSQNLKLSIGQMQAIRLVGVTITLQFTLGVLTLIYNVPIVLGVLHQVGAFFLFSSLIYLLHRLKRKSVVEAGN